MDILQLKEQIRARDGYRCAECGLTNDDHLTEWGSSLEVHRVRPGSCYSLDPGVCVILCKTCHGSKPKSPRGSSPYWKFRLERELALKAGFIAYDQGKRLSEYINEILLPLVEEDFQSLLKATPTSP